MVRGLMNKSYSAKERLHLEKIKSMECIICNAPPPSAAHHIRQDSAYYCVPLCMDCHQGAENGIHGRKAMWKIYKLDELDAIAKTIERLL